ncbi:MAG: N-acetyltransferase family protein [Vicinamibacterales bacterium]
MVIRDTTEKDLPAMVDMLNVEIAQSPYVYAEAPVTLNERRIWLEAHRVSDLPVLVAETEDDAAVVGWGALSPYRPSSGYRFTAELSVYVARASQRRGAGSAMVQALITRAERRGIRAIVGSVDADNTPSLALLGGFGFIEVARLPSVGYKFGEWRTQLLVLRHPGTAPWPG